MRMTARTQMLMKTMSLKSCDSGGGPPALPLAPVSPCWARSSRRRSSPETIDTDATFRIASHCTLYSCTFCCFPLEKSM